MSRYASGLILCLIFCFYTVSAQVRAATNSDMVPDPAGAFIRGVKVTVKNLDTGITNSALLTL